MVWTISMVPGVHDDNLKTEERGRRELAYCLQRSLMDFTFLPVLAWMAFPREFQFLREPSRPCCMIIGVLCPRVPLIK